MNTYDAGDQVRISVAIADDEGRATDPTVLSFLYLDPTGALTTLTYGEDEAVGREDAGGYYVDLVPNRPGIWSYRWECSGTVTAAVEGRFTVRRSAFA